MRSPARHAIVAAVITLGVVLALSAAPASAATVEVQETRDSQWTADLRFQAAPAEANHVTFSQVGEDADHLLVEVVDTAAPVTSRDGCEGGGAPGTAVLCRLHKPRSPDLKSCGGRECFVSVEGTGWTDRLTASLGDGGSYFDASSLTEADWRSIPMTVTGGSGDDFIATAAGNDEINPGAGSDRVLSGDGSDRVVATPAPDGPDFYDLGGGRDTVDYSARSTPVFYRAGSVGEDGAPGEGDTVLNAEAAYGGSADDVLIGGPADDYLNGRGGADLLIGEGGNDTLVGEEGANRYEGGEGDDAISELNTAPLSLRSTDELNLEANRAEGGPGNDTIALGAGPDEALGGPGDDTIFAGGGNDSVAGEEGADRLVGGWGADRISGGPGSDTILVGTIPAGLSDNEVLRSPGELETWRDTVDCGNGRDGVSFNPWDLVRNCEWTALINAVELARPKPNPEKGIAMLPVGLRSAGHLTIYGHGIRTFRAYVKRPRRLFVGGERRRALLFPVRSRGRARRILNRVGRARVRVKLRFRPAFHGIARTRARFLTLRKR